MPFSCLISCSESDLMMTSCHLLWVASFTAYSIARSSKLIVVVSLREDWWPSTRLPSASEVITLVPPSDWRFVPRTITVDLDLPSFRWCPSVIVVVCVPSPLIPFCHVVYISCLFGQSQPAFKGGNRVWYLLLMVCSTPLLPDLPRQHFHFDV